MKHLGDITKIHGDQIEPVDCITFGSPCQDLSIAGRRAGLAGERSGLFMEAVRIIKEMRSSTNGMHPTFAVWENVPGAFSSNGGEDFRTVLEELARVEQPDASIPRPPREGRWSKAGAIAGNGWSLAWRQLDAQYWGKTIYDGRTGSVLRMGTPQRRKRIALVANFGGQRAGEILFEREGLPGHFDESVQTREEATGFAGNCPSGNDSMVGEVIPINTQTATRYKSLGERTGLGVGESGDPAYTLQATHEHGVCYCIQGNVADRLGSTKMNGAGVAENVSYTLNTVDHHAVAYAAESGENFQPVVLESNQAHATATQTGICPTLPASMGMGGGYIPMITDRKVFDARGNGDGKIVPTITGDHQNRITDYTAIAVDLYNGTVTGDTATSITCRSIASHSGPQVMESYGIGNGQAHASVTKEKSGTLDTMHDAQAVAIEHMELPKKIAWIVRRLTPTECERLQGYPDGYTDIGDWTDSKGKKHKYADSPRYKALGNSIALPQWFWLVQKMRPYMKEKPTLGSLFDGIGGFPLIWQRAYGDGTARWASEIEEFPMAVTKMRFGEE
nr:MAG TPA: Cytosine specific methyltransferase [Caudoviricetes sp.]